MKLSKQVSTYEFEVPDSEGEPFHFRVEIFSNGKIFTARFFRYEYFRSQPTFPQSNGEPMPELISDEVFLVRDASLGGEIEQMQADSEKELLRAIATQIAKVFPTAE